MTQTVSPQRLLRKQLASVPRETLTAALSGLPVSSLEGLSVDWGVWARDSQLPPEGDWTFWLILAGRGWGKTRTGAETVRAWARRCKHVNLIGPTLASAREIMVTGESGVLACCARDERPEWSAWQSKLLWPNGAISQVFSAEDPDRLRGFQSEKLWADEIAAWSHAESWTQAKMGLRLGDNPQAIVTTTPQAKRFLRELATDPTTVITRGSTHENRANLAAVFLDEIIQRYEGTRLGRQELYAELLDDLPGALWRRSDIDKNRRKRDQLPPLRRVVVAVDPAVSSAEGSDETGIVAAGVGEDGRGYVLDDASGVFSPDEWARRAVSLYRQHEADCLVYERNQGGDAIEYVLRAQMEGVARVKGVHATRGKTTRAEPISALYEQGKVSHVGIFDKLEDQMVNISVDFDKKAAGFSPDRVDALVWAFTELFQEVVRPIRDHSDYDSRRGGADDWYANYRPGDSI